MTVNSSSARGRVFEAPPPTHVGLLADLVLRAAVCLSPVLSGRQHFPALLPTLLAPALFLPTLPGYSQSLGCATLFLLSLVSLVWLQRFHPSHTDQSNRAPIQMEGETTSKAVRSVLRCSTSVTCHTECRLLVSRLQQSKQIHFSQGLHATQVGHGCTQGRLNYTGMYVSSNDQSVSVSL